MFGNGQPKVRTGQGSTRLTREEFARRFKEHFYDPAFDVAQTEIDDKEFAQLLTGHAAEEQE